MRRHLTLTFLTLWAIFATSISFAQAGTLMENFDDGNLDEWDIAKSPGTSWRIENGELIVQTVNSYIPFLIGEETWTDYTVGVRAKIMEFQPTNGHIEDAILRVRSRLNLSGDLLISQSGYAFGFATVKNNLKQAIAFTIQGNQNLVEKPFEWELDTWYDLKVTAEGDRFQFYVNDELVLDYVDGTHPTGKAGFGVAFTKTTVHFDNFFVTGDEVSGPNFSVFLQAKLTTTWGSMKSHR